MRCFTLFTKTKPSMTLLIGLCASAFILTPASASDNRAAPAPLESQWLSIGEVFKKLEAAGFHKIEKIERERGGYEVKATTREGERVKLYLNPQTGEVVSPAQRGHRDERERLDEKDHQRNANECNERRCRDDLPSTSRTPTPPKQ